MCSGGGRGQVEKQLAFARILLDAGANISARDNEYLSTPLAWAARMNLPDMVEFLPLLGDREAIILGQGVSMPMRVRFDDLGKRAAPRNMHVGFSKAWKAPNLDRQGLDDLVSRWRRAGREKA